MSKSENLAQDLYDAALKANPELQPYATKIAEIIISTATVVHERTRGHLIRELAATLVPFYKTVGLRKPPADTLAAIRRSPTRLYRVAAAALSDATVTYMQQFAENFDDLEVETTPVRGEA